MEEAIIGKTYPMEDHEEKLCDHWIELDTDAGIEAICRYDGKPCYCCADRRECDRENHKQK